MELDTVEIESKKFLTKLETINTLFDENVSLTEGEVLKISILINREAAEENAEYRKEAFANKKYIVHLMDICDKYKDHEIVVRNLVSAIGFIATKYDYTADFVYKYLSRFKTSKSDKIAIAIVKNIYKFPQFDLWVKRWNYILSIPEIKPHNESLDYFSEIISRSMDSIPKDYLDNVSLIFREYIKKHGAEDYMSEEFQKILAKIKIIKIAKHNRILS